jgi:hypothetical protein
MAANILGVQPLKFGTTTMTGFVVETYGEDQETAELVIEDEGGNIVTQITDFAVKSAVTLEVIPKTAMTRPAIASLFNYGDQALNILNLSIKRMKKDVEKWTIKGNVYPGVTPA